MVKIGWYLLGISAVGLIVGLSSLDSPDTPMLLFTASFLPFVLGCSLFFFASKKQKRELQEAAEAEEKERQARIRKKLVAFHNECVKSNVTDVSVPRVREKMQLLSEKIQIYHPDGIEALWQRACEVYTEERPNQLHQLQEEEKKAYARLDKINRYYRYSGTNKRIQMLTDEQHRLKLIEIQLKPLAHMVRGCAQQEKEFNPYTWGGIANGIAGSGAGIYTAIKTEQENEAIRARNAASQAHADGIANEIENATASELLKIQAQLEHAKDCLVADTKASEVLSMLNLWGAHVEVSETGAYTVSVYVKAEKALTIYDNRAAVADGTIVAHVFEDGTEIGSINLVLPCLGIGFTGINNNEIAEFKSRVKLEGMRLSGADPHKSHTVTFSATNLWLMEK